MHSEEKRSRTLHTKEKTGKNNTTQNNLHKESMLWMDHRGFGVTRVRSAVLWIRKWGLWTLSFLTLLQMSMLFDAM